MIFLGKGKAFAKKSSKSFFRSQLFETEHIAQFNLYINVKIFFLPIMQADMKTFVFFRFLLVSGRFGDLRSLFFQKHWIEASIFFQNSNQNQPISIKNFQKIRI